MFIHIDEMTRNYWLLSEIPSNLLTLTMSEGCNVPLAVSFNPQEGQCYMGGKGGKEVMFGIGKGGVVTAFFFVDCLICVTPDPFPFLMNG